MTPAALQVIPGFVRLYCLDTKRYNVAFPRAVYFVRAFLFVLVLMLSAPLSAAPLRVLVSIAPVASMVEQLGGDLIDVHTLLPPGADPHHYAPTPRRIRALADADLLVWAGAPFEHAWRERVRAVNSQAVQQVLADAPDHYHEAHAHEEEDPHVWTSPAQLRAMALQVRDQLITLRPMQAEALRLRHQNVDGRLAALQQQLTTRLQGSKQHYFLVFHPSWGYFAREFGLTQLSIEEAGKGPGARALAKRIDQARRLGIKHVFVQPQFDRRAAAVVANALDAEVVELDPLSADMPKALLQLATVISQEQSID